MMVKWSVVNGMLVVAPLAFLLGGCGRGNDAPSPNENKGSTVCYGTYKDARIGGDTMWQFHEDGTAEVNVPTRGGTLGEPQRYSKDQTDVLRKGISFSADCKEMIYNGQCYLNHGVPQKIHGRSLCVFCGYASSKSTCRKLN